MNTLFPCRQTKTKLDHTAAVKHMLNKNEDLMLNKKNNNTFQKQICKLFDVYIAIYMRRKKCFIPFLAEY